MNRQTLSRVTAATLLGVAVLVGGGKSYASDADDVKATINGFHAALTALDLAKMDAIWAHDDRVMDKEPLAKAATLGWEGTRKNFEGSFGAIAEVKVTQGEGPHIYSGSRRYGVGDGRGGLHGAAMASLEGSGSACCADCSEANEATLAPVAGSPVRCLKHLGFFVCFLAPES